MILIDSARMPNGVRCDSAWRHGRGEVGAQYAPGLAAQLDNPYVENAVLLSGSVTDWKVEVELDRQRESR
jgi:hypothetical protein